jgi:hypothetical protein
LAQLSWMLTRLRASHRPDSRFWSVLGLDRRRVPSKHGSLWAVGYPQFLAMWAFLQGSLLHKARKIESWPYSVAHM